MQGFFSENTSETKRPLNSIPGIYLSRDSLEESSILNSRELLVFILESIQDGVSILDVDMRIRYVNSSIKHWYSDKGQIVGRKCFEIYHNRSSPCEKCPVLRTMESKKSEVEIVPYQAHSVTDGWQELFSIPIFNKSNELIALLEYVRDISLQRFVEHKLISVLDRLDSIEKRNDLLTSLLRCTEEEKDELEKTITSNMERYVKPSLEYLKRHTDEKNVEFVEGLINEIMHPVTKKHSSILDNLTSREIQIAEFIREGKTSKEIAEILSVTKKTVDFHRANIRKKLSIKNNGVNLRSYLLSHQ